MNTRKAPWQVGVRSLRRTALIGAAVGMGTLASGCNNAGEGAVTGGLVGLGVGSVVGAMTGNWGAGAAIGAASGAAVGAVIGDQNERNDRHSNQSNW